MKTKCVFLCSLLTLLCPAGFAQNVTSTLNGTVVDSSGAVIPGANGQLTNHATAAVRTFSTGPAGQFVVPNLLPGTYDLSLRADGFKQFKLTDIVLTANEVRSLGRLKLELGAIAESVTVEAQGAQIQLSTGERSGLVTGQQIGDIAVKGRDFVSYMVTVPGVVDTGGDGREALTRNALSSIHINGGRSGTALMIVDGLPAMDSGNNGTPDEPNMDAIAEVKILTSNYQAEYGRNSGGTVSVITKSGSQNFHGSAYNYYRHESLNANSFYNNRTGTSKPPYRYRITGYSLGGPLFIPNRFNTGKDKLFFFFSQELIGSKIIFPTQLVNTPSQLERNGDFSRSFDVNGKLYIVKDPLTGKAFPGNIIPKDRFNGMGQAILNFYPLPNYADADPANLYRWNYKSSASGGWPRRQEVGRMDFNLNRAQFYYRITNNSDVQTMPYRGGWPAGNTNFEFTRWTWERPARSHAIHAALIYSPTLVHDITVGKAFNSVIIGTTNEAPLDRSRMGNIPQWFKDSVGGGTGWIPNVRFGGVPGAPIDSRVAQTTPNVYPNDAYSVSQNLSKILGPHTLKLGMFVERNIKGQPTGTPFRGELDFRRNTNNPFDSGHSFANALLGNFASYQESTKRLYGDYKFWVLEWYAQDTWRLSRRLSLDFGLRFNHLPPTVDDNRTISTFDPAYYNPAKAPVLYRPALDSKRKRVAQDPVTGAFAPAVMIGLYVPGSGDFANGYRVGGVDGYPAGLYETPWLSLAPRVGLAYDVFGNGKTALRAGFGVFYDKVQGNRTYSSSGEPPVNYNPQLFYGNLATFTNAAGAIGPTSSDVLAGRQPLPRVMDFSFGIQHQLRDIALDASYVGSLGRHLMWAREMNPIAMYARFDPANEDPAKKGVPLQDNFLRPYRGLGGLTAHEFGSTSNYHSLQMSANRRFAHGLLFGASYTWSKFLTTASGDTEGISPYFNPRSREYGPGSFDRRHVLVLNYTYNLPKLGARTGFRPAGWVLDRWQISGITTFMSGSPFTPGFSTTDGQDITGSSEGARITVNGNPHLGKGQRTYDRNFNTGVFSRTPTGNFGNAGVGILNGPGVNNWDVAVTKRFPLFSEGRFVQFRFETFNTWNHTQFSGLDSTARFDPAGNQINSRFGAYTSARNPRNIQLSLRINF